MSRSLRPPTCLVALAVGLSLSACSVASETGAPGPLGPAYDGVSFYTYMREAPAELIPEHRAIYEAIQAAVPFDPAKTVSHEQAMRAMDDGALIAKLRVRWQTYAIDGKQLVLSAGVEATEYGDGWSCASMAPTSRESGEAGFFIVDFGIRCDWASGRASSMVGLSFVISDAAASGELVLLAGEVALE